jgi:hypothetical protein
LLPGADAPRAGEMIGYYVGLLRKPGAPAPDLTESRRPVNLSGLAALSPAKALKNLSNKSTPCGSATIG